MGVDFEREKRNCDPSFIPIQDISPRVLNKRDAQTCWNQYISLETPWKELHEDIPIANWLKMNNFRTRRSGYKKIYRAAFPQFV